MAVLALSFAACQSAGVVPSVDVKLYAGDSSEAGVTRNNPGSPKDTIRCTDPRIDGGYWLSQSDFNLIVATYVGSCKEWRKGTTLVSPELLWQKVKP